MEHSIRFIALRGHQAGRWYFTVMCKLKHIEKLFDHESQDMLPEHRAQRVLNKARIPELARYIVDNPKEYIFSALTVSIGGNVEFEPIGDSQDDVNIGHLSVPLDADLLINDGQHRRAAIVEAIRENPELGEDHISVVFFVDAGLKRSQQMFADLNRHAIRPTKSIGILYDHRDPLSALARRVSKDVSFFNSLTEMEKTTISNRSSKLFTLSSIYQANKAFLGKAKNDEVSEEEAELVIAFWEAVGSNIPEWQLAKNKEVSCAEMRSERIHSHGIALQALANAGRMLVSENPETNVWKSKLRALREIDWSRSNSSFWEGRALSSGRVSKSLLNVLLTTVAIKQSLGIELTAKEQEAEQKRTQERNSRD